MKNTRLLKIVEAMLLDLQKKKRRASKALEGPYYFLWMKPRWHLLASPTVPGEESHTHAQLWDRDVLHRLGKHYGLDTEDTNELALAIHGMPRGRVVFQDKTQSRPRRFVVYHGNDTPSAVGARWKNDVISEFRLTELFLNDEESVVFKFNDHEAMNDSHKEIIQSVIGKIPY